MSSSRSLAILFGADTRTDPGSSDDNAVTTASPDGGPVEGDTASCAGEAVGDSCTFAGQDGAAVTGVCSTCGNEPGPMCHPGGDGGMSGTHSRR